MDDPTTEGTGMTAKKAASPKPQAQNGSKPEAPAPKSERERIEVLEEQVKQLRIALMQLMLQNPQVQQALAAQLIQQGG
jgi:hypothetical protein